MDKGFKGLQVLVREFNDFYNGSNTQWGEEKFAGATVVKSL